MNGSRLRRPALTVLALLVLSSMVPIATVAQTLPATSARARVWDAAQPRIQRADREAVDAEAEALKAVDQLFTEAKQGARAFADDVLSFDGKLSYAAGVLNQAVGVLGDIFSQLLDGPPSAPPADTFRDYVRAKFEDKVLSSERLRRTLDDAAARYARAVAGVENRLLVDLQADLPETATAVPAPRSQVSNTVRRLLEQAVDLAVSDAGSDMLVASGRQIVSNVVGGLLADQVTDREKDSTGKQFAVDLTAGLAVDKVIDGGMAAAGYDPAAVLAARVKKALDLVRRQILEGDAEDSTLHGHLFRLGFGHPDVRVRQACRKALDCVGPHVDLGMAGAFKVHRLMRAAARNEALAYLLLGPGSSLPPPFPIDPARYRSVDDLIAFARDVVARWKGGRP